MGFTTLLDIVGSVIMGGILMMIAWRLSDAATEKTYNNSGELSLQQNLTTIVQMIEYDFRKIGYCSNWNKIPQASQIIRYADPSKIRFLTDVWPYDGNIDSISYYLGPASECLNTPNPRDRILYRVVNNEVPVKSNLGVTQFRLVYYNNGGDTLYPPITIPGEIASMEINVAVESVAAYDTAYSNAYWQQIRLTARNFSIR